MSLDRCIPELLAEGKLTKAQADEALAVYGRHQRAQRKAMGHAAADALASDYAARELEFSAAENRRRALLQVDAQKRAIADIAAYRADDNGKATIALLAGDERAPYLSFEYGWRALRGEAHARIDGLLMRYSRDVTGRVRNRAELDELLMELKGKDSGNLSAQEHARAFGAVAEDLRLRYNAAGGHIGKIEGWAPQNHESVSIREAGLEAWRDFTMGETQGGVPVLDRDRMLDDATGLPFDDETLWETLGPVHETLASDGWATRTPGAAGSKAIANTRAEHRFLHFTPEGWIAYNERFGRGTLFDAMMAHIDGMTRDIALMERLGPNPAATAKWLRDGLEKAAHLKGGRGRRRLLGARPGRLATDQARMDANIFGQIFDEVTGKNRTPHSRELALGFSAIRSFQVATKLGGATLSTTSDQATQILARRFNGFPVLGMARSQLKMLNPLDDADRRLAIRSGLIAEDASHIGGTQARLTGEELTGEVSRRTAEAVLRLSGLNAVTQGGRWSFGMDAQSWITHQRGVAFDALDAPFRNFWIRHGFDAADWDRIRATPLAEERGAQWFLATNVADQQLRTRLLGAILYETDYAVPVPGLRTQAAINARAKKGTWLGELLRTGFQFKSFPVTVMMQQGQRIMAMQPWSRAGYAVNMFILMSTAGVVTLWLKDIAKGRDPRELDGQTLLEAFAQGGGGGIYGDFIRSSQSRFGSGFEDTLKGPAWQTAATLERLTLGAIAADRRGDNVNYGGRVVRALRSELPGGSLWYTRLAFERLVLDQLQSMIDPHYARSWGRMAQRARDQGSGFWWAPGELTPERAPDLSAAIGGEQQESMQ